MKKIALILLVTVVACLMLFIGCENGDTVGGRGEGDDATNNNGNNETPINDFEFESGENGMIVKKYKGNDASVVIPAVFENKKVTELSPDVFAGSVILEEITLPEYMTVLDMTDFSGCDSLKTITCKGNISKIIEEELSGLETLNLPNTEKIAFSTITKLTNKSNKLLNFDLSGAKEFVMRYDSSPHDHRDDELKDGLNITLSNDKYNEIKNSYVWYSHKSKDWIGNKPDEREYYLGGYYVFNLGYYKKAESYNRLEEISFNDLDSDIVDTINFYTKKATGKSLPVEKVLFADYSDGHFIFTVIGEENAYDFLLIRERGDFGDTDTRYTARCIEYSQITDINEIFTAYFACSAITVNGVSYQK